MVGGKQGNRQRFALLDRPQRNHIGANPRECHCAIGLATAEKRAECGINPVTHYHHVLVTHRNTIHTQFLKESEDVPIFASHVETPAELFFEDVVVLRYQLLRVIAVAQCDIAQRQNVIAKSDRNRLGRREETEKFLRKRKQGDDTGVMHCLKKSRLSPKGSRCVNSCNSMNEWGWNSFR